MPKKFSIAVTGDTMITRRLSVYTDERYLSLIKAIREADVAFTHLEMLIHDYDDPEVYPAAEAGWTWMRAPRFVADELKWAGFKIVSHASNHSLDYSYGGLYSTWKALDEAGLPHAGTGRNLAEAREPAYLETGNGRVALISMCSSFAGWARAGEARRDLQGRPGLNPLRFYHKVDSDTAQSIKELATKLGWWVTKVDKMWLLNPAGMHNTIYKFVETNEPEGVVAVVNEDDAEDNLRSIKAAKRQADYVLVHLHSHEWDPAKGVSAPAKFVISFARDCIDAGADVFIGEGSHATLRGMEIYKKRPIFYDPGDFVLMANTVKRLPADYYWREGYDPKARNSQATTADAFDAHDALPDPLNPPGGYRTAPVLGAVLAVCDFEGGGDLTGLRLLPVTVDNKRRSMGGIPLLAEGNTARKIIDYVGELSSCFGTHIEFREGIGLVEVQ